MIDAARRADIRTVQNMRMSASLDASVRVDLILSIIRKLIKKSSLVAQDALDHIVNRRV